MLSVGKVADEESLLKIAAFGFGKHACPGKHIVAIIAEEIIKVIKNKNIKLKKILAEKTQGTLMYVDIEYE
ncbi:hypothetical protein VL04_18335 [Chromobacterium violaceum]|nr:hypothetical protein VK93_16810 [Chromobacterium violaceum]KMN85949.1 hypothetical protein VL02_11860 [Chromobacterium violaceum]KMN88887.1 hypothetical protein VL04_18335 [Chromobacterium violaceum]KMO03956.1 hypothetical protein VL16_10880 [Chromobacterium violaceum]